MKFHGFFLLFLFFFLMCGNPELIAQGSHFCRENLSRLFHKPFKHTCSFCVKIFSLISQEKLGKNACSIKNFQSNKEQVE